MSSEASTSGEIHSIAEVCSPSKPLQQQINSCEEELSRTDKSTCDSIHPSYYFFKPELLDALSSVGATSKAYTSREILGLLKAYLLQNRSLIDSKESQFVNCGGTPLARAFQVDRFQYSEVRHLLLQNLIRAPYSTDQSFDLSQKASSSQNNCTPLCKSPIHFPIPTIPEYQSGPESDYSYQAYETVECYDSDSELPASVSDQSEEEAEVVEYEPVTDEEENKSQNSIDSESDVENLILILDVDEQPDSTEDCFADESDTSAEERDLSADEGDKWSCLTCGIKNQPFFRYCLKCWQLRKDWYPEPPKKKKKRKPRPKKDNNKRRLSLQDKVAAGNCSDAKSQDVKDDDLPIFILEREGSTASCSTQASSISCGSSSASAITSASQDSGFGSQDLSTYEAISPTTPTRKRKASEMERPPEANYDLSKKGSSSSRLLEENGGNLSILLRKFEKFSSSASGLRWLRSSRGKEILEALENVSSDSDLDQSELDDRCTICYSRPKDASIIHGSISHIGFCYPCAKKLFKAKARCPLCRRRIHMITKNAYV